MTETQRKSALELLELIKKSKKLKASLAVRRRLAKWYLKILKSFGYRRRREIRLACISGIK
jgi:hypothetical protein